jgi:threonyl-tRNA synthetase
MLDDDDHRAIARRLRLLHFQEEAPGMVFWHPRGLALHRVLEEAQRAHVRAEGYEEVRSPQVMRRAIWEKSGHWEHFRAAMFALDEGGAESALKPVSCPGHLEIVSRMAPSYRDLPIRLAEIGVVHRDEASGALHGLMRVRQFSQDDGHVFCAEDDAEEEVVRFLAGVRPFYARFGFVELELALSLRPSERAGEDAVWDRAEALLRRALERRGERFRVQPGAGAFYGPKIEIALRDRAQREWQCGTIQMDLVMPARFGARYVDAAGERRPLAMLHRALYGSLERFMGVLLEHHRGSLPPWLAPAQVVVLPIAAAHHEAARHVERALLDDGLRGVIDAREHSLAKRIAEAHQQGIPFAAVIGDREVERASISLRSREAREELPIDRAREELRARCARPR